jgi:hypothetical protein
LTISRLAPGLPTGIVNNVDQLDDWIIALMEAHETCRAAAGHRPSSD